MVKKSKVYLGLMTVLSGTVIMVSTVFGQVTSGSSIAAPVKKDKNVNETSAQTLPAATATTNSIAPEKKTNGIDTASSEVKSSTSSSAVSVSANPSKTSQTAAAAGSDSVKTSGLAAVPVDSSVKKDSSVVTAVADSAKTQDSTVALTAPDSTKSPDSTVAITDSSAVQDSLNTAAVSDSSTNISALDSSKITQDSTQTAQVDSAVTDTQTVADATPEIDMSKPKKEYINTGMGLVFMAGTAGPQAGLIGSLHQFMHCTRPINIRAFFSFLPIAQKRDMTISEQPLGLDFKSKVISGDLFLDFHPFKNSIRLTAGVFFSGSKTAANLQATEGLSMEMITITPEEMGSLEFVFSRRPVQPYLGLGTGNALSRRVSFMFDFGVAYTGALQVKGTGTGMIAPTADNAQNLQNVFDKHNELFWWPVLSIGLGIKIF
ncbi:MAG: hypothetical protein GX640_10315 [Fibrobacter sp.]|nr:hypothetical protein [Fibrobacter sp.]